MADHVEGVRRIERLECEFEHTVTYPLQVKQIIYKTLHLHELESDELNLTDCVILLRALKLVESPQKYTDLLDEEDDHAERRAH